jgi:hypothetical protein
MLQGKDAPLRISSNAQLGDPLFAFTEIEADLPMPPAPIGFPADPRELERRVLRLEARVQMLDLTVADMQAHTIYAQWQQLVIWCRMQWRKFLGR